MNFNYFEHKDCEYYAECHGGTSKNCLFCFCPLYTFVCPGTPEYTKDNIKDCTNCIYPHKAENYDKIIALLKRRNELNK